MIRLFVSAVAIMAASPAIAADLIVDGGFENPVVTTPDQHQSGNVTYAVGSQFGGDQNNAWTVVGVGSGVTVTSNTEYTGSPSSPTYYNAHSGGQWLDLSGVDDNGERQGVAQTIATNAGTTYTLGLWLGTFIDGTSSIEVDVNGVVAGTFSNPTPGSSPGAGINYAQFMLPVLASSSSTTIAIYQTGGRSAVGLDDVSFNAPEASVPEPASWATMMAGFGLIGSVVRSARRTRATLA